VLRRAFREADVVGRLGGDEFVAFGRCGTGAAAGGPLDGARATAARLRQRVERLLAEESRTIARPYALAGSAGVAVFDPATPATVSTLLLEADVSLYDRKRARKRVGVAA
jgi:diguanylate cyclase (GGDEF)-like protein